MAKFEIGKTYQTRSFCDYDRIIRISIISRTEKTVTFKYYNQIKRKKISIWDGVECFSDGNYFMANETEANNV